MARKKKKERSLRKTSATLPPLLARRLHEIDRQMFAGELSRAGEQLEGLDRRYPARQDVLLRLSNVYHELKDYQAYQAACERLVAAKPSAAFTLMLAGAYLANVKPILALRTFRRFLDRWPGHPRADEARRTAGEIQARLDEMLVAMGLTGPDALEIAALHEEVQALLGQGKYPEARREAERLLQHRPNFPAALNNIAQTYFAEGLLGQAIATSRQTLEIDAENVHALSNLSRYLFLNGRYEEARGYADRLRAAPPKGFDVWTKKAEALSCLGEDQALLELFQEFEQTAGSEAQLASGLFFHLVAVAALRLGREGEARRHWKAALRRQPGFEPARANLDDLRRPVGERHAPWPFPFHCWVSMKLLNELIAYQEHVRTADPNPAEGPKMTDFLQDHPGLTVLVPALLDRGDPPGREFAFRTALAIKTPEMLTALREFALSQRGPDALRSEAAQTVAQGGLLPPGPIRLWLRGEWREILLFGWEITPEPFNAYAHSQRVQELLAEAHEAMRQGELGRAEGLFKQGAELEPDSPDILNNLAATYQSQGRHAEASALLRQVHERFPDYLFAGTAVAKLHIQQSRLAEAKALLDPLMARRRFHTSEFAALASAEIDYLLAQKNRDAARSWLEMWAKLVPDSPILPIYRQKLRPPPRLNFSPTWWS